MPVGPAERNRHHLGQSSRPRRRHLELEQVPPGQARDSIGDDGVLTAGFAAGVRVELDARLTKEEREQPRVVAAGEVDPGLWPRREMSPQRGNCRLERAVYRIGKREPRNVFVDLRTPVRAPRDALGADRQTTAGLEPLDPFPVRPSSEVVARAQKDLEAESIGSGAKMPCERECRGRDVETLSASRRKQRLEPERVRADRRLPRRTVPPYERELAVQVLERCRHERAVGVDGSCHGRPRPIGSGDLARVAPGPVQDCDARAVGVNDLALRRSSPHGFVVGREGVGLVRRDAIVVERDDGDEAHQAAPSATAGRRPTAADAVPTTTPIPNATWKVTKTPRTRGSIRHGSRLRCTAATPNATAATT